MASTTSENIKRVISNPDNNQMPESKITKISDTKSSLPPIEDEVTKLNIDDAPMSGNHDEAITNSTESTNKAMHRAISAESSKSDTTSGDPARSPSVGNWGWFEDVHAGHDVFMGNKSKEGGLLHMGSELMNSQLYAGIESERGE
eukprot:scaffold50486_cov86-Cyclotella_meneghiniana.AAC.6